jgi:hypothetical protein
MARTGVATERILAEDDVAALFGIEMAPGPLAPRVEETKKNARSVKTAPARRVTSSGIQPAKESLAREMRPTKKKKKPIEKRSTSAPTAPSAIEPRQERTGAVAKSSGARTVPEKIEPLNKTVRIRLSARTRRRRKTSLFSRIVRTANANKTSSPKPHAGDKVDKFASAKES